jgi:hypothetical protein
VKWSLKPKMNSKNRPSCSARTADKSKLAFMPERHRWQSYTSREKIRIIINERAKERKHPLWKIRIAGLRERRIYLVLKKKFLISRKRLAHSRSMLHW